MRHTCTECGDVVGSWVHTDYDDDGHGINPVCDSCYALLSAQG